MRPERLNPLFADVASLAGVGPAAARALERLEIRRVRDLLFHFPIGWRHTSRVEGLGNAREGERVSLSVDILSHEPSRGRGPFRITADDGYGIGLILAFFGPKGSGLANRFPVGSAVTVAGRLELWNGRFQMIHPELVRAADSEGGADWAEPVYPLTEGFTSRRLATLTQAALEKLPELPEWIEPSLLGARGWPGFGPALHSVHGEPESASARDRLAYDELLAAQLAWALVRARRRRKRGTPLQGDGRLSRPLLAALPFRLTGAQTQAISEIAGDLAAPHAMLRLLQGDVGAGKTLVALMALLLAVEAGAQGAFLAPTDLLARQHMATLQKLIGDLPVRLGFLSGREKGKAREALLADLAEGRIDILIGTHALFSADVNYRNLGLAVVDEQHRFGVAQRMMLAEKADRPPHLLVMTATPIPRTLALANYGEMDISKLGERPPGRQPVDTRVVALGRIEEVLDGLGRHLAAGRQAYWVCPLLEPSEEEVEGAPTPAVTRAEMLRKRFGNSVALVHGKLPGPERDREMARFQSGEAKLLVATTVIEVGVDVPNASLMLIESAERFGLAQLHQLRGRVGRGSDKSVCLLLRGETLSETARERLKMMRATDDGFAIAEADLKLRGAGELLGTRQSGDEGFRLATPEQVQRFIETARDDARLLVERGGGNSLSGPRGEAARLLLYLFEKDAAIATLRGG
ncbi:ATP-dependent DNA helicase RecG [Sandaracinobacter sp. RS1-74]|uniref:ATP-dependent DNA helicase RecG n=1 Tax=Sandaracinobacteroides sayramensis TaxID=2913411 RepID=UPI001EDBFA56|nr:ATP-dependent DNA helicase RecG [Sandaracinobacteroides sayramensis]MCG2839389.1 ATP-dependent DNA helicase RecG [Sandaracinobacteroides sayramensis]